MSSARRSPRRRGDPDALLGDAVWRALADPTRRRILDLLRAGPRTTGALADAFVVTRFAVMKHLKVLEEAGLVTVERRGRERWNHLNATPIRALYRRWIRPFEEEAADRLLRLKRRAEGAPRKAKERRPRRDEER